MLQVPGVVASARAEVWPTQIVEGPEIAAGAGFTVTITVDVQLPSEYDIVVVPADEPKTFPEPSTVATIVLVLLHNPPLTGLLRFVELPLHSSNVPAMGSGLGLMANVAVAGQPDDTEYEIVAVPLDAEPAVSTPENGSMEATE